MVPISPTSSDIDGSGLNPIPGAQWRACYVFIEPGEPTDELLIDIVAEIRTLIPADGSWFFIRYSEDGHHLRIRVRGFDPQGFDALVTRIRDRATARLGREIRLTVVAYEPEVERYGGPIALLENEALFRLSSELAVRIIMAGGADSVRRISQAVDLKLAAVAALELPRPAAVRFFDDFALSWRRIFGLGDTEIKDRHEIFPVQAVRQRLADLTSADQLAPSPAVVWRRALTRSVSIFRNTAAAGGLISPISGKPVDEAADMSAALMSMLTSQMHMLNNRLGLSPVQEYHLARSLSRALAGDEAAI